MDADRGASVMFIRSVRSVWFVWLIWSVRFVRSVSFIWLNQTDQINQRDQMNQIYLSCLAVSIAPRARVQYNRACGQLAPVHAG